MSNFNCPICNVPQIDSPRGYIAGCSHYPPEHKGTVTLRFDDDGERDCKGFYDGGFYVSRKARDEGRYVHPVRWCDHTATGYELSLIHI